VKNKIKIIIRFFIFAPLLCIAVFIFPKKCLSESSLKLGQIQYSGGAGKTDEDFIKILNPTDDKINLKGHRLVKRSTASAHDTTIKAWTEDDFIPPEGFYLWANSKNGFAASINAGASTTETIAEGNGIALRFGKEDEGIIIDSINWQEEKEPSEENPSQTEAKNYLEKVRFNEILPSPISGEKEFVEIINLTEESIDFSKWYVKDEKNNKKSLSGGIIKNNFYYKLDAFSLNSERDSVFLYDENDNLVDSLSYIRSKSSYSYSFDKSSWRWTKYPTPGEENRFEKILDGKIKMDSEIYANVYADFEAKTGKETHKFKWNFGDSRGSTLKKTRHKYEKAGTYDASLKMSGDGEENILYFTVKVENYSAPKVRIIKIAPNPKGKDSKEYIIIENKSKHKIDLEGWSIATGWKSLVNHPIRDDFIIKPGKSKKLTKKICAFTLNNSQNKIELRYPDGNVAQKIKYNRKKDKIEDDEIFEITEKNWTWNKPQNSTGETLADAKNASTSSSTLVPPEGKAPEEDPGNADPEKENAANQEENVLNTDIQIDNLEFESNLGKFSENPSFTAKKKNRIQLVSYATQINMPDFVPKPTGQIAGAYTEKIVFFEKKHWLLKTISQTWTGLNSGINQLLNKL